MRFLLRIFPLRALIVLMIVALATSGFAHRFVTPAEQAALDYAQAFDLEASEICGGVGGKGAQQGCDACRLHAAMSLPEPAVSMIVAALSLDLADWTPQPSISYALSVGATRRVRAPPTV
ncbi:polyketide synthase [Antarcticimicrobium luteum]|uniref:Polyketide synthase n=1 Tax=Antarcticimicrobium luteum TaxID=2547397 RepID=A0A4V3AQF8_9RHOB|nr:polyketide synthase [Antarcticimicrobium luteum]TDK42377.1 polyketide synthase [Antarcticimicrobium luteum]